MIAHEHLHARFVYVRASQSKAAVPALDAVPIPGQVFIDQSVARCCSTHNIALMVTAIFFATPGMTDVSLRSTCWH